MKVKAIRTQKVLPGAITLIALLDQYIKEVPENSVLAITSKIISLCENRVISLDSADKETLVKQESSYYLPGEVSKYGYHFTITNKTLISMAGIDESNSNNNYVLWPTDSQKTANEVRQYLAEKFKLQNVGVVIVDSTCTPLRLGTSGVALAFSGFDALNNYVGKPDLFGRPYKVSRANIAGGLATTAVLIMGEGAEQTPFALFEDLDFVTFQPRDPSPKELEGINISSEDDLFAPFFDSVKWLKGDKP